MEKFLNQIANYLVENKMEVTEENTLKAMIEVNRQNAKLFDTITTNRPLFNAIADDMAKDVWMAAR